MTYGAASGDGVVGLRTFCLRKYLGRSFSLSLCSYILTKWTKLFLKRHLVKFDMDCYPIISYIFSFYSLCHFLFLCVLFLYVFICFYLYVQCQQWRKYWWSIISVSYTHYKYAYAHAQQSYGNTYPFPNFNGYTAEVWEWKNNFIPHFIMDVLTYSCWDQSQSMLMKGTPGMKPSILCLGLACDEVRRLA